MATTICQKSSVHFAFDMLANTGSTPPSTFRFPETYITNYTPPIPTQHHLHFTPSTREKEQRHLIIHIAYYSSSTPSIQRSPNKLLNLFILCADLLIRSTTPGIPHLGHLIQPRVIDPIPGQPRISAFLLHKHGRAIAPKVLAVGNDAAAPGIPADSAPLVRLRALERRGPERVDAEKALPLVPDGVRLLAGPRRVICVLTGAEARRGCVAACDVLRGVACGDEGVKGVRGGVAVEVAAHAFVGREVARYLEKLHAEEHGYPG
jgi:hypothetical protein